jgi:hypothetical protein
MGVSGQFDNYSQKDGLSLLFRDFERFTLKEASILFWNCQTFLNPRQGRGFTLRKLTARKGKKGTELFFQFILRT